jgi:hypothetical protein
LLAAAVRSCPLPAGKNENSAVNDELSQGNCWLAVALLTSSRTRLSSCSIGSPGSCPIFVSAAVNGLLRPSPSSASVPGAVE